MDYLDTNERKTDRVLVLKTVDDKSKAASLLDPEVFSGKNKLHLVMDQQTNLWYFKYDKGTIPGVMKQQFTSAKKALFFARQYLKHRNIQIAEVLD